MLSVLDETPDDDLLMLTRTCRRLRCLSASAYLRRLGILKSCNGCYTAYLHGRVRPEALSVLCSTPLAEELSLHCDIYYLIQYQQELIRLCKNYVILLSWFISRMINHNYSRWNALPSHFDLFLGRFHRVACLFVLRKAVRRALLAIYLLQAARNAQSFSEMK